MDCNQNALAKEQEAIVYDYAESNFKELSEKLEGVDNIKKILVLRTARNWIMNEVFSVLREKYPGAELSLLAQPSLDGRDEYEKNENIDKLLWAKESLKRFGIFSLGIRMLKKLKNEKYDLAVVPLSGIGINYLVFIQRNIHRIIMGIKPKNVIFVDSEGATLLRKFNTKDYYLHYFFFDFIRRKGFVFIKALFFIFMLFILSAIACCDLWSTLKKVIGANFDK